MPECHFSVGKSMTGKRERGPLFVFFTPHSNISLVSRSYPDTINPAFHLFLALNMYLRYPHRERDALSLVRHLCTPCVNRDRRQEWDFSFFSLRSFKGVFGHSVPFHCCQKVFFFPSSLWLLFTFVVLVTSQQTDGHNGSHRGKILKLK